MNDHVLYPVAMVLVLLCGVDLARGQVIRVTDVTVSQADDDTVQIRLEAEAEGIELGSYFISLSQWSTPEPPTLDGFIIQNENGSYLLASRDFGPIGPNHRDGGERDESDEPGVFQVTLDTSDWPEGVYFLNAGAHNRPATGAYISDRRPVRVVIGNPPLERVTTENAPDAEHQVIYKREGVYACFPDLHILPDGRWSTTFGTRIRASHIDQTGGSATYISDDHGNTWTEAEPGFRVIDHRWQTDDGRLTTAVADGWIYVDADRRAELEQQGKSIMDTRPGVIAYLGGAHWRESTLDADSWSRHQIEMPDNVAGLMNYSKPAVEVVTSEGVRMVAVYGRRLSNEGDRLPSEVFLLRSEDDGASWTCEPMYAQPPAHGALGMNETALVETPEGRLLALMRTAPEGYMYQSHSDDGGRSWSEAKNTGVWGFPAHVLELADGRLLMSYGYRRRPMGIRAVLSDDGGQTWNKDEPVILRDDGYGTIGDLGYPLSIEYEPGRVFTIYYITTTDGITHVASTHWSVPETSND